MKKLKSKFLSTAFVFCLLSIFLLTGTYEQNGITTKEYVTYSAVSLVIMAWSGHKAEILCK